MPLTITRPAVDAHVNEAQPSRNRGGAGVLRLRGSGSSAERRAFLFAGRSFPFDATIIDAKLVLTLAGSWTNQTLTVRRVTSSWRENRVNWNNQPSTTATNAGTLAITGSDGDEVEIDLTDMFGDVAGGGAWFGVRLTQPLDAARLVYSSDHPTASYRPRLEVEWRAVPDAPDNLTPTDGLAVCESKPVLAWQFGQSPWDHHTETEQAFSQVQIDDTDDFASPEYDSTKTANVESEWDLDATAYGGISAGATRYWRVRVWDDADLVSEWSDPAEFTREDQGTLSITSPAGPDPGSVEETTPPITWSYTPADTESQESFEVVTWRTARQYPRSWIVAAMRYLDPDLWWALDGDTGATDLSGNGRDGTGQGGVDIGGHDDSPFGGDGSTDFDGTDDYISSGYEPFVNGTVRTFCGWAYSDVSSGIFTLIGGDDGSDVPWLNFNAGNLNMNWYADATANFAQWTDGWPGSDQWVHWALAFDEDNDEAELWINGESLGTAALTDPYNTPGNLRVGARAAAGSNPFDGRMAHVAVFERALTPREVGLLAGVDIGREELDRNPREIGTDTSYTLPAGLLRSGEVYETRVRVWDDLDRASTVGCPTYVEDTREFTYDRAGTPAEVETLTVENPTLIGEHRNLTGAQARLRWTRTQTPDYFSLRVDGQEVLDRIDPEDVAYGPSTWELDFWGATAHEAHLFEVEAVVDDAGVLKHSEDNAQAIATISTLGIWLVDPDDGLFARVIGDEGGDVDFEVGEVGETFSIVGSRKPVRITETIQGHRGQVSGYLDGSDQRDDFLRLKGRFKELRLIVASMNFPVVLEEVSVSPFSSTPNDRLYEVQFSFFQSGEFHHRAFPLHR